MYYKIAGRKINKLHELRKYNKYLTICSKYKIVYKKIVI